MRRRSSKGVDHAACASTIAKQVEGGLRISNGLQGVPEFFFADSSLCEIIDSQAEDSPIGAPRVLMAAEVVMVHGSELGGGGVNHHASFFYIVMKNPFSGH